MDWKLIDGKTSDRGEGQLIVARANNALGLMLDLGAALADWHSGMSTTRPYQETFERDEELLERTKALATEGRELLEAIEGGGDD